MGAFKESLKIFEAANYNRFAISGELPHMLMPLITNVISTFEHAFEVKYFTSKDDAVAWLKDYKA